MPAGVGPGSAVVVREAHVAEHREHVPAPGGQGHLRSGLAGQAQGHRGDQGRRRGRGRPALVRCGALGCRCGVPRGGLLAGRGRGLRRAGPGAGRQAQMTDHERLPDDRRGGRVAHLHAQRVGLHAPVGAGHVLHQDQGADAGDLDAAPQTHGDGPAVHHQPRDRRVGEAGLSRRRPRARMRGHAERVDGDPSVEQDQAAGRDRPIGGRRRSAGARLDPHIHRSHGAPAGRAQAGNPRGTVARALRRRCHAPLRPPGQKRGVPLGSARGWGCRSPEGDGGGDRRGRERGQERAEEPHADIIPGREPSSNAVLACFKRDFGHTRGLPTSERVV